MISKPTTASPTWSPRNKLLDQLQNDSTRPIGDLARRAVERGHGGATTRRLVSLKHDGSKGRRVRRRATGVDGGGQPPPNGRAKKELTLCLHLKDDISVTDILKISKIT